MAAEDADAVRVPPSEPPVGLPAHRLRRTPTLDEADGRRWSEPPLPSAPISDAFFPVVVREAEQRLGMWSEPPPSGPVSGVAAPSLFRGDAGPGYWLTEEAGIRVEFGEGTGLASGRVMRMSPTGLWFNPAPGQQYHEDMTVQVWLRGVDVEIGPLQGRVAAPTSGVENPILGITFYDIPYRPAREVLELLRELTARGTARLAHRPPQAQEIITDPARIRAIVKALSSVGNAGRVTGHLVDSPVHIIGVTQDPTVHWRGPTGWAEGASVVDLIGYNSIYRLHVPPGQAIAGVVVTPMPTRIERLRHRLYRRGDVHDQLELSFHHPLWPRLPLIRQKVRDLSFGGLSFVTHLDTHMLFAGLRLPALEIHTLDGDFVRLKGEVRAITTVNGEDIAGVSIGPFSPRDEPRWNQLIAKTLYPTTDSGELWAESLWDLFDRSGYFSLSGKETQNFMELHDSFVNVTEQSVVKALVNTVVFPSERGVEATASVVKAYAGSWCGHQLAKHPGKPPRGVEPHQILRDLYVRVLEHPLQDQTFEWLFAYLEVSVPWNKKTHFAFAEQYQSIGDTANYPFRLMECPCAVEPPLVDLDIEVLPATDAEILLLARHLGATYPAIYTEVLDLVESRILMTEVSRAWEEAGYERLRRILVARRDDTILAVAVLETGERGTNLFRLLDSARLFSLAPDGRRAHLRLVNEAKRWFRRQRRESFVYFMEDRDDDLARSASMCDLGEGMFWAIRASLVPDFLEYVLEVSSPRAVITAAGST